MSNWFAGQADISLPVNPDAKPQVYLPHGTLAPPVTRSPRRKKAKDHAQVDTSWVFDDAPPSRPSKAVRKKHKRSRTRRSSHSLDHIYRTPCHPSEAVDCPFEPNVTQSLYDRSDRIRKLADKSK